MEVILLKDLKIGKRGTVVNVKPGYAKHKLIPSGYALLATQANLAVFEARRAEYERINAEAFEAAQELAAKLDGISIEITRQAADDGKLYGSVTPKDIAKAVNQKAGLDLITAENVSFLAKLKEIGEHTVHLQLHPEIAVNAMVLVNRPTDA